MVGRAVSARPSSVPILIRPPARAILESMLVRRQFWFFSLVLLSLALLCLACSSRPRTVWLPRDTPLDEVVVLSGIPFRVCRGECALALVGLESVRILEGEYFRALLIYESHAAETHYFDPQSEWLMTVGTPDTTFSAFPAVPPAVISATHDASAYGDLTEARHRWEGGIFRAPDGVDQTGRVRAAGSLSRQDIDKIVERGTLPGLLEETTLAPGAVVSGVSYFEVPKRRAQGKQLHREVYEYRQIDPLSCRVSLHLITPCDTLSVTVDPYDLDSLKVAREAMR